MKVKTLILTGAMSVGVAVGAIGYAFHGGAQTPVTVVDLVKRNLASGGNEGGIWSSWRRERLSAGTTTLATPSRTSSRDRWSLSWTDSRRSR